MIIRNYEHDYDYEHDDDDDDDFSIHNWFDSVVQNYSSTFD